MAIYACYCLMLANKSEIRVRMVKIGRRRKSRRSMALRTIIRQGFLMAVGVAGYTSPVETQIGVAPFFQPLVSYEIRLVALAAIDGFMLAR